MLSGDAARRITIPVMLLFALTMFGIQLVTNRPVIGVAGLLLLAVPGFVLSQSFASRSSSWPEVALTTVGATLVLMVFVGVAAALSPHGLDSSSVAAIELWVLSVASILWLVRSRRELSTPARPRISIRPGSIALVALGGLLGAAGFVVATRAAETQPHEGYVQFWSIPPAAGADALLGIENASGGPLDCKVTITLPNESKIEVNIGTVRDGESLIRMLPRSEANTKAQWDVSLHCGGLDGSTVERRLTINPPQ